MTDTYEQRKQRALQRPPLGTTRPLGASSRQRRAAQQQADPAAVFDRSQFVRNSSGSMSIRRIGDRVSHLALPVVGAEVTGKVPTLVEDQGAQGYSMAATEAVSWTFRRPLELGRQSKPRLALVFWPVGGDLNSATFTLDVWYRSNETVQSATANESIERKVPLTTQRLMYVETIDLDVPVPKFTHLTLRLTCDAVSAPASGEPGLFAAELVYVDRNKHRHES